MARPAWARRTLGIWLTGGGALAPDAGLTTAEVRPGSGSSGTLHDESGDRVRGPEGLGRQVEGLSKILLDAMASELFWQGQVQAKAPVVSSMEVQLFVDKLG